MNTCALDLYFLLSSNPNYTKLTLVILRNLNLNSDWSFSNIWKGVKLTITSESSGFWGAVVAYPRYCYCVDKLFVECEKEGQNFYTKKVRGLHIYQWYKKCSRKFHVANLANDIISDQQNYHKWMDDMRFYVLFNSISIIYNQDDGRLIMKGCVQWSSIYGW